VAQLFSLGHIERARQDMSTFRIFSEFDGTVTNDAGVIIDTAAHRDFVTYETDGVCYYIHKECGNDGVKYIDYVGPKHPLLRLGKTMDLVKPKTLPKRLVEQMKRDIPLAYEALGKECVLI